MPPRSTGQIRRGAVRVAGAGKQNGEQALNPPQPRGAGRETQEAGPALTAMAAAPPSAGPHKRGNAVAWSAHHGQTARSRSHHPEPLQHVPLAGPKSGSRTPPAWPARPTSGVGPRCRWWAGMPQRSRATKWPGRTSESFCAPCSCAPEYVNISQTPCEFSKARRPSAPGSLGVLSRPRCSRPAHHAPFPCTCGACRRRFRAWSGSPCRG
jgi:hypothetical protein